MPHSYQLQNRSPSSGWLGLGSLCLFLVSGCGSDPVHPAGGGGSSSDNQDTSGSGGYVQATSSGGSGGSLSSSSGGAAPGSGGVPVETGSGGSSMGSGGATPYDGWTLVWSDEFEGSAIDANKWEHETDCWGGGNNEEQCYVADAKNSFLMDGILHIRAIADNPSGPEGGGSGSQAVVSRGYSSARLRTLGKADFKYGRFEARLQLPFGQGLWPAFWMLPSDNVYGGWAASGEIDIMEAVNLKPDNIVYGTLHYGGAWPDNTSSGDSTTLDSAAWDGFHTYAVEWEEGKIRWLVDGVAYETQTSWFSSEAEFPAPFNQKFHILLNVAVGGEWPGSPNGSTQFPQEMLVDYVRVYQCAADLETGHGCGSGS